ncbi:hypothetical protein LTR15_011859 [Elasticomyces elasticus]|nr:hypothetical protein LTR15_011859 [Elasticomyces elasticus]
MIPKKRGGWADDGGRSGKRVDLKSNSNFDSNIAQHDDKQLPSLLWVVGEHDIDFDDYAGCDVTSSELTEREDFIGSAPPRGTSRASSSQQTLELNNSRTAGADQTVICYGMLANLNCQRVRINTSIAPAELWLAEHEGIYVLLDLHVQPSRCVLGTPAVPGIGLLNSKHCSAIQNLIKAANVRVQLYISKEGLVRALALMQSSKSKEQTFAVHANIYGPSLSSHWVSTLLAESGFCLQDPIWLEAGLTYLNPHVITFEGLADVDVWLQELSLRTDATGRLATTAEWNAALDSLPQHVWSSDVKDSGVLDGRLAAATHLLPHQAAALDFMCKRESGQLDEAMKYWVESVSEEGIAVYNHRITGVERDTVQSEPRSGILADDMGLGKTLTSIALILATLDEARGTRKTMTANAGPTSPGGITLVVVPNTMIMDSWVKEIERHTVPGTIRWATYHGQKRIRDVSEAHDRDLDVLITTYGTVTAEYRKPRKVLFHAKWFRLILDEAHVVRSHRTRQFEAVVALDAQHHWGLTGTPICNKIDDLGALIRFCRVPILEDRRTFQTHLTRVANKSFSNGCKVLRDTLTPICLRRTKAILQLPEPRVVQHVVEFSVQERRQYDALMRRSRRLLDENTSGNLARKVRHTLLQAILQLRIFCNRGTYTPEADNTGETRLDADEALTLLQESDDTQCAVCHLEVPMVNQPQSAVSGVISGCGHLLCVSCHESAKVDNDLQDETFVCALCDSKTAPATLDIRVQGSSRGSRKLTSSKLNLLMDNLEQSRFTEKSIVFSAWRRTLDIASDLCMERKLEFARIDGTTPQIDRLQALDRFKNDPTVSVLLMTLGTGAMGLNLAAASRVHILEPQWNPAVESQALGRVVRIGQDVSATVLRYVVRDSVEEGYQKRKLQLAAAGFNHRSDEQMDAELRLLTVSLTRL